MVWNAYNIFKNSLINNNAVFQFLTDEIKVILLTDQYVFDPAHVTIGALEAGDQFEGTGYTLGGKTLTGKSQVGYAMHADNLSWEGLTGSVAGALVYKASGGTLMAHLDFETTYSPADEELQINWNGSGIFVLTTG